MSRDMKFEMRILLLLGKQVSELFNCFPELILSRYFNSIRELKALFLTPPEHLE